MKILIILILILIIFILNYKNHNEKFDITKLDKIQDCADNTNTIVFNNISTNNITIDEKELNKYLLDIVYPIGSFYVQFPDISHNQVSRAFPDDKSPQNLFGGIWELMWDKDAIFFRTEGNNSNVSRDTTGIQPDAMINLTGYTSWTQTNYWSKNVSTSDGVFKNGTTFQKIRTDKGNGDDIGIRNLFELSAGIQTGSEVRVKNRIIRIWKRKA